MVIPTTRALALVGGNRGMRKLHSLPRYYGLLTALWCLLPCLLVVAVWAGWQNTLLTSLVRNAMPAGQVPAGGAQFGLFMNDVHNLIAGAVPAESASQSSRFAAAEYLRLKQLTSWSVGALVLVLAVLGILMVRSRIAPALRARNAVESIGEKLLLACASLAVLVTVGIVLSVFYESLQFFRSVGVFDFLFGTSWSPQTAIRADQVGASGSFGAVPLFLGTAVIFVLGVQGFVLASSSAPLGEITPPAHEGLVPRPTSPYGASKLAGEAYCSAFAGSYGLPTVALRFSNVYGPYSYHKGSVVAAFCKAALAKGHAIHRVFFYHDGVNNSTRLTEPPQDDRNIVARWSKLAADHGVDLVVCVAAALRRGIKDENLAPGFRISGLGQLVETGIQADRLVVFGG